MKRYLTLLYPAYFFLVLIFTCTDHLQAQPCNDNSRPTLASYDSSSVSLNWSPSSSAVGYQLEYGAHGYTLGQGTLLQTTQSNITITGLSQDTAYDIYIRDSCGPTSLGTWSNYFFYVDLPSDSILSSFPRENFINDTLPKFWGNSGNLSRWHWRFIYPTNNTGFFLPQGFAKGLYDHTDSIASGYALLKPSRTSGKAWLSTPYFRIDSFQHPLLRFWLFRRDTLNNPPYHFKVFAEAAGQRIQLLDYTQNHPYWKKFALSLDSLGSDTLRIMFEYPQANIPLGSQRRMADLLLDDVEVVEKPACALPKLEAISQIGPYQATIISEHTGSAKQEIRFTTAGIGQFITNATVNDTFNLTGLPPATRFQFYLRDSCAGGQQSAWSGP